VKKYRLNSLESDFVQRPWTSAETSDGGPKITGHRPIPDNSRKNKDIGPDGQRPSKIGHRPKNIGQRPQKNVHRPILDNGPQIYSYTVCHVFSFFSPICITYYPPFRTINFGKYLRLFQIKPIKTVEFRFMQIGKKESKNMTYCS
jgi:hypothetical protein